MHILINISSCGTLIGQALTKTAFAVTLLRMSNQWQKWFLWFCIATMNIWMVAKVIIQWAKVCGKDDYQNWYRLDFCIGWQFRDDFKEGGNGMLVLSPHYPARLTCHQSTTSLWILSLPPSPGSSPARSRCAEWKRLGSA